MSFVLRTAPATMFKTRQVDEVRDELKEALAAFKDATLRLDLAWEQHGNGDAIADYPECLPSFEEFACSVQAMEVRDDA